MKKTINYFLTSVAAAALLMVASCSKDATLPQIDGFNNSNEVGATNLVAHWTFDDTNNERLSSTAPSNTYGTAGFTTGQIGKALQLTKGALVFPPIDKINSANALNNFTVSLWVNVKGNKGTADEGFSSFFSLIPTTATDVWPDITVCAETGQFIPTSDTLFLKSLFNTHPTGGGNSLQDNVSRFNSDPASSGGDGQTGSSFKGAGKWSHYVISYDGATSIFKIYGNAISVGGYSHRGTTGKLIMATPLKAVFGSIAASDIGFASAPARSFNKLANASIDDVRVFNTVLADKDITALFNLGTAGR